MLMPSIWFAASLLATHNGRPWIAITIITVIFLGLPAQVDADGNSLLKQCGGLVAHLDRVDQEVSIPRASDHGFCLRFMQGITQTNTLYQRLAGQQALFCLPGNGLQNGQAARIVVKYLRERPGDLHKHEFLLALGAFKEAFPCD